MAPDEFDKDFSLAGQDTTGTIAFGAGVLGALIGMAFNRVEEDPGPSAGGAPMLEVPEEFVG